MSNMYWFPTDIEKDSIRERFDSFLNQISKPPVEWPGNPFDSIMLTKEAWAEVDRLMKDAPVPEREFDDFKVVFSDNWNKNSPLYNGIEMTDDDCAEIDRLMKEKVQKLRDADTQTDI